MAYCSIADLRGATMPPGQHFNAEQAEAAMAAITAAAATLDEGLAADGHDLPVVERGALKRLRIENVTAAVALLAAPVEDAPKPKRRRKAKKAELTVADIEEASASDE